MSPPSVADLSPIELQSRLSNGERLTLLDVREPFERAFCAISTPESARDLFVPMADVESSVEMIMNVAGHDPIVVYCHHGIRSLTVATWLARLGCPRVFNLVGGIDAWAIRVALEMPRY
jgi:rhodanese-related sulfurtransferase